jgi:hypothetical protein
LMWKRRKLVTVNDVGRNGFAEVAASEALGAGWMYPFEPAGVQSPVGPSTKGDHHVATACADD